MNTSPLIPSPDPIPAPAWVFHVLDVALFGLHIVLINVLVGGTLLFLFSRVLKRQTEKDLLKPLSSKLPITFALGINLGVAPLLFLQVNWGHLFYSSSVLLGTFWILVIPLVIIAYYGMYIHAKAGRNVLAISAITVASLIFLYISFIFVNNILLMMQPDQWKGYFSHRTGTLLMFSDPTLFPRYLHFIVASVAIAGLFTSLIWTIRKRRNVEGADMKIRQGLTVFGYATVVQAAVGLWFLISLKREMMLEFMGGNPLATAIFGIGFLSALGAIATALSGKFRPTLIMAIITLVAMILTRDLLRGMYLQGSFDPSSLHMNPQYGVLGLFLVVLVIGLASVIWMLRAGFRSDAGRVTP
jgi:hypothetical protein